MTADTVVDLGRQAMELMLYVAAPPLLTSLAVGLVISILQAATQINEQTLSFIPKFIATFLALVLAGSWMISMITDFIRRLYGSIPQLIG
ncbi:MAG: flagellar biosynthetic protein FliQ [Betaproteobacteria bacterium]|jgi:flagellar biosynthetic protein FliQ|nr:flagellar biosynthetic protein FliQ [Betaproteobacteria bacterium]NBY52161.1 flagellar biosynthetic protein FliQ [Betaproteobacteria bacterium]